MLGGSYGTLDTSDGELIIYDRTNPEAWIQSDTYVDDAR